MTLWSLFRWVRMVVFVIAILLSIACTIFYILLTNEQWRVASDILRALFVSLAVTNGLAAIFWYLMIVLLFDPLRDAVRVTCLLFFQAGGAIFFSIFKRYFRCALFGSPSSCKLTSSIVIYGTFGLSGLLLCYLLCLAVLSYMQYPTRKNPDAKAFDHLEAELARGVSELKSDTSSTKDSTTGRQGPSPYVPTLSYHGKYPAPSIRSDARVYYPLRSNTMYPDPRSIQPPGRAYIAGLDRPMQSSYAPEPAQYDGPSSLPNPFDNPLSRAPVSPIESTTTDSSSTYSDGTSRRKRPLPRRPDQALLASPQGPGGRLHAPPAYAEGGQVVVSDTKDVSLLSSPSSSSSLTLPIPAQQLAPGRHSAKGSFHSIVASPPVTPVSAIIPYRSLPPTPSLKSGT